MKILLYCVFEDLDSTRKMLQEIKEEGYNGTLMGSSSIKRSFSGKSNAAVFSLSDYAEGVKEPNLVVFFVIDEKDKEALQKLIRSKTEDFQSIHGAMFSLPVLDYEGSF